MVRIPDDAVDNQHVSDEQARAEVRGMQQLFDEYYETGTGIIPHPVFADAAKLFHRKKIPTQWSDSFFEAMVSDTQVKRYHSYEQVQEYMYGSANVVGLMMCKLIGYDPDEEEKVLATAQLLGEAMQYTNFLRDIKEDYLDYGRIYMPSDRLQKHQLTHEDLIQMIEIGKYDQRRKDYMKEQIMLTKDLYKNAMQGVPYLSADGRKAVYHASKLYEGILNKIEKNNYNIFSKDAHTTKRDKIILLLHSTRRYAFHGYSN